MKRVLKIIGVILLLIILVIGAGYVYIMSSPIPSYPTADFEYKAETDSLGLERGKKLVSTLCFGCHGNHETGKLTGRPMTDAPPEFGDIYVPNITQDTTYGIGKYSDAELLFLLRTGVKRDGQYAPAYMAKLPKMADEDLASIIAFLNSDDHMVSADATPDRACKPAFLTKMLCRGAWKPYPMPEKPIPMPDTSNQVELGKYLAFNLECFSCHSKSFETNNYLEPEQSEGYFGGGTTLLTPEGNPIVAGNITPHKETGIGSWSSDEFLQAVKFGSKKDEAPLQIPMQPYNLLSDQEILAIYEYLQTVPAIENNVERIIYN